MRTERPSVTAPGVLQSALEQLRLEGAIFFRSQLTEGFAFESTPAALADALHPGAERIILFHIVARGSCWVAARDGVARIVRRPVITFAGSESSGIHAAQSEMG